MNNNELAEKIYYPEEIDTGSTEYTGLAKLFFEEGYKKGFKIGYEKGYKIGVEIEKTSVALNLLKSGFSCETISTITEFPESKVIKLRDRFIRKGLLSA